MNIPSFRGINIGVYQAAILTGVMESPKLVKTGIIRECGRGSDRSRRDDIIRLEVIKNGVGAVLRKRACYRDILREFPDFSAGQTDSLGADYR